MRFWLETAIILLPSLLSNMCSIKKRAGDLDFIRENFRISSRTFICPDQLAAAFIAVLIPLTVGEVALLSMGQLIVLSICVASQFSVFAGGKSSAGSVSVGILPIKQKVWRNNSMQ
jgi:hypothetical protein